ncbi:MAG TPA: TonB C-terminal domain-containing protein, partial [Polyangiaceae bacterium]
TSAPSPDALKTPEAIPSAPVSDAQAPPPDAEIVKKLDEVLDARADVQAPNLAQPGSPGGVKEGTETDPLKARAVSQYQLKIAAWFNARFRPPLGELTCEELKPLTAKVSVNVGGDRSVAGYTIVRPSGNPLFDARVKSTMDGAMGQQLPPPPPLYPDILGTVVSPTFSGKHPQCQ